MMKNINEKLKMLFGLMLRYRIITCALFTILFYCLVWGRICVFSTVVGLSSIEIISAIFIVLTVSLYFEFKRNKWRKWLLFVCVLGALLASIGVLSLVTIHEGLKFLLLFGGIYSTCELEYRLFREMGPGRQQKQPRDTLNRSYMYAGVYSWIRTVSRVSGEGQAVAIMGDWGTGKTHLRRYLEYRLSKKHEKAIEDGVRLEHADGVYQGRYVVGEVNLWRMRSYEEAWSNIEKELLRIVGEKERLRRINSLPLVAHALKQFFHIDSEIILAVKQLVYNDEGRNNSSYVEILSKRLSEMGIYAVIFFDDVERADVKIIEYLLPLIHRLKKISRLIVICNIAPDVLQRKLLWNYSSSRGSACISKIFDIVFEMPVLSKDSLQVMAQEVVREKRDMYPKTCNFLERFKICFATPRDMERVFAQWCSTEWMYLTYSEQAEWQEKFTEETIFLSVALRYLRPNIVTEILENGAANYFGLFACQYLRNTSMEWKNRFEATYNDVRKNPHIKDILIYMSKCSDSHPEHLAAALEGKYAERLILNINDIENVLIPEDGSFKSRLKEEIQKRFMGSVPFLIHKSITEAYGHMVANMQGSRKLSNAIRTSLKYEKINAHRLDAEDCMPFQLTLTFFARLLCACSAESDRFVRLNIYQSMRFLMIKTSLSQNAEIVRYLFHQPLYSINSNKAALQYQENARKSADDKLIARLKKWSILCYVFNFCLFLLARHTSTLSKVRQSGFAIDWHITHVPRELFEDKTVAQIVNRSVDAFCRLHNFLLHTFILSVFSYLITPRVSKVNSNKQLVITILDSLVVSRIMKNVQSPELKRLSHAEREKLSVNMQEVIDSIQQGRYALEEDVRRFVGYDHQPVFVRLVRELQSQLKILNDIKHN